MLIHDSAPFKVYYVKNLCLVLKLLAMQTFKQQAASKPALSVDLIHTYNICPIEGYESEIYGGGTYVHLPPSVRNFEFGATDNLIYRHHFMM